MYIIETIGDIYRRMAHAAMRAGREVADVNLVAVSKTAGPDMICEAYEAGLRVFGESRVQEAVAKARGFKESGGCENISWHMIGHLQRNKTRQAVELFDLIHSVDSVELLGLINRHAGAMGKVQRVLLQLKVSDEASKSGAGDEREVRGMYDAAGTMANVRVEGLMCVPPYSDDQERSRPYFARLRSLAEGLGVCELSMGMTHDFEAAIVEGATMVRIGSAIFGERVA